MKKYYINSYNENGVYPYDTVDKGAPNFKTLLAGVAGIISDGDTIYVEASTVVVDDSSDVVNIDNRITIVSDINTPVKLKSTGVGMNLNMSGITIQNLYIYSDTYSDNVLLSITNTDAHLVNCKFGTTTSIGNATMVLINNGDGSIIRDCTIHIPLSLDSSNRSYGIYANNSSYCQILRNVHMWWNTCVGISFVGSSSHNDIFDNIVGVFDSNTYSTNIFDNIGISFGGAGNYNKIHHNVIGVSGSKSQGIIYSVDQYSGIGVEIDSNCIYMRQDGFGMVGLSIPYTQNNIVSSFKIINNILEFRGLSDNSIGICASIDKDRSVINYNNLYGFNLINMFINNGDTNVINKMGSKTIFVDPRTVYTEDSSKYTQSDIRLYYCNSNSECIGSGYLNHNIGVGVDADISFNPNNYVTIIDTVTSNYNEIDGRDLTINTFFNSVFTCSASVFNDNYRAGNGPYPSSAVYKNQFKFNLTVPSKFPFTQGDKFFNKDLTYICANKIDLRLFDGITCPPNPGYGFPDYKRYEDGLWGYPRINKPNTCTLNECVIQDTISPNAIRFQNTINDVDIWIQDMIVPSCLS